MPPVLAHFIADWLFQSQYMASDKVKSAVPALLHVAVYGLVFWVLVGPSWAALAVIVGTHYVIDRYRLARHVNWAANFIAPIRRLTPWERRNLGRPPADREPSGPGSHGWPASEAVDGMLIRWRSTNPPWSECSTYGSPPGVPDHIAFMVLIAVDQIMHLVCNYAALRWLA